MKSLDGILTTPQTGLVTSRVQTGNNPVKIRVKQYTDRECVVCRREFLALNNTYHCSERCDAIGSMQADNAWQER